MVFIRYRIPTFDIKGSWQRYWINNTISGTISGIINSFEIWCLWQDQFLSRALLPAKTQIMIWMMNSQGWGWTPWLCWSRAFTIPYINWRAGTNCSILVGNAWLYGRNQRKFAEGPWFTSCSCTKPTTRWHKYLWGNSGEQSKQDLPTQIIPAIVYDILSDMFQDRVQYRVQCIWYCTL